MTTSRSPLLVALFAITAAAGAAAQVSTGRLSGTVTDEQRAVLPGVTVTVKNIETGVTRAVTTDGQGRYMVPALDPGSYEITAELAGFQTSVRRGVTLAVGQEPDITIVMNVGQMAEQLVVVAEAPLVDTRGSAVGNLVDDRQIRALPLNGRSFEQLAALQPAVANIGSAGRNSITGFGNKITIAGARMNQISFLLDGTDINDTYGGTPGSVAGQMLGVDTVREFQVLTSTYSAEFGRSSGGVINSVTRSGTNQFHGSGFEFLRDSTFDAKNFFNTAKPPFTRNQFGGTAGGPIVTNRVFFFAGYEGLRQNLGLANVAFVPTAQARQGILPGLAPIQVAPAVQPFLALFPLPNGREIGGGIAEYRSAPEAITKENFVMGKIDVNLSQADSFFVRYNFDKARDTTPEPLQLFETQTRSRTDYLTFEERRIVSARLLNIARVAYNRSELMEFTPLIDPSLAPTLPYLTPYRPKFGDALGPLNVTGLTSLGSGVINPRGNTQGLLELSDVVSITSGSHLLKFGTTIKRYHNYVIGDFTGGGNYRFLNLANFLQGRVDRLEVMLPDTSSERNGRQWMFGFFAQEDYTVTPRLTVNLGLRYEPYTDMTEADGKIAVLRDPAHDTETVIGGPIVVNPSRKNVAPRVGVAWAPGGDGRTSVRGGFGVFYEPLLMQHLVTAIQSVPPLFLQAFYINPPFPVPPAQIAAATPAQLRVDSIQYEAKQPTRYQYSVTFQRELLPLTVVQVGYVGATGRNNVIVSNTNTAVPLTDSVGRHHFLVGPQGQVLQQKRNLAWGSLRTRLTAADSRYNGLFVALQRRLSGGLQFQANYTYGKSTDAGTTSAGASDFASEAATLMDPDCVSCDDGLSAYDVRHTFVANFSYEVPTGPLQGIARAVLGGWQLNGIVNALSGNPFSPRLGFDRAGQVTRQGGDGQRAEAAAGADPMRGTCPNGASTGTPECWFTPSAFELPPAGYLSTLPRNTITGPRLLTVDLGLTRTFRFTEGTTLQFRAEAFNLLNRVNLGLPANVVFTNVRFNADGSETPVISPTAGRITATRTPARQVQFGLKVIW